MTSRGIFIPYVTTVIPSNPRLKPLAKTNTKTTLEDYYHYYISNNGNKNFTYFFCHLRIGSAYRSLRSIPLPLVLTSGCFLQRSQPTWEKKNPRLALCGSASVSLYLWCTLWSLAQSTTASFQQKDNIMLHIQDLTRQVYNSYFMVWNRNQGIIFFVNNKWE